MGELDIYLISRLDYICGICAALIILSGIGVLFMTIHFGIGFAEQNDHVKSELAAWVYTNGKGYLKLLIAIFVLSILAICAIPDTKTYIAMKVLPQVTSPETKKELIELYNIVKEKLKED